MIKCPTCGADNIEGLDECESCGQPLSDLHLHPPLSVVEKGLLTDRLGALHPNEPVMVPSDARIGDVLKQMVQLSIGCVIVTDDDKPLGIFTERDALIKLNENAAEMFDRPVSEFMTTQLQTLQTTAKIAFAVHRMDVGSFRHIPIVDEEKHTTGVISVRDILQYMTEKMTTEEAS